VTCTLATHLRDAPGACQATLPEREFNYVPWTVGVNFEPVADTLVYAKASRGHRAGGYNFRALTGTDADVFDPESVLTYEIGTRAELFDRRLRIGLAVFRSDFTDMQVRTEVELPGGLLSVPLTQNAGEARIEGGELEITGLLGNLRLSGGLGITRGEYTELDPRILDLTLDSEFLFTPETTVSLAADFPVRTSFGAIDLHADYGWRDDEAFAYDSASLARQDAYGLLNAMIVARFERSNVELRLWGRNLKDERYIERAVDFGSLVTAEPGNPRTYGASLTYRFGRHSASAHDAQLR
jgi:iron complex outermembrane receptor protein